MPYTDIAVLLFLLVAMTITILLKKLTPGAGIGGVVFGWLVYEGAAVMGILSLSLFFVMGTVATGHKLSTKQQLGISERDKGKRTLSQVAANAGMAALLGLFALIVPHSTLAIPLMIAACFSSATADTLSSEMGNVYGRKYYNILTLKKDLRGLDGVISLEGTLIGIAGSFFIAIGYALFIPNLGNVLMIVVAGTIGNLADSYLGAFAERRGLIKNDAVNFLNTAVAAFSALIIFYLFR